MTNHTREHPFHLHILGICGTFMGGLALIARELGYRVTGSDQNVYPPMSVQLEQQGIQLMNGYQPENLKPEPDLVIVGNAIVRGNLEIEAVLNQGLNYTSGPQWLADHVLANKWVLAVAGTHGKTTTSSLLSWILEAQGFEPGFLIGGIPLNFGLSARLGKSDFFVVEADEYDSAFFDKRSKFIHYRPRTVILNNLEFDHADIFDDLAAIKRQFHHLVRTIPGKGQIIVPKQDAALADVLQQGCWTPVVQTAIDVNADYQATLQKSDASQFNVLYRGQFQGMVSWSLTGQHNIYNALSAIAAAHHIGIMPCHAIQALHTFKSVKRRMEVIGNRHGITLYDDFAHHPTAIQTTLNGLRQQVGNDKIIAVIEPGSNTMRLGTHSHSLVKSLAEADLAIIYQPENLSWDLSSLIVSADNIQISTTLEDIINTLKLQTDYPLHIVFMSNGSFGGIHYRLLEQLG